MKSLGAVGILVLIAVFVTPASVFCQDDDAFWNAFELDSGMPSGYPGRSWGLFLNPADENFSRDSQKLKAIGGFPLFIGVGKIHYPHGRFNNNFLSGPITRDLAGASRTGAAIDVFNYDNAIQIGSKSAGVVIDTPAELFPMISFSGGASYVADFSGSQIFQNEAGSGSQKVDACE